MQLRDQILIALFFLVVAYALSNTLEVNALVQRGNIEILQKQGFQVEKEIFPIRFNDETLPAGHIQNSFGLKIIEPEEQMNMHININSLWNPENNALRLYKEKDTSWEEIPYELRALEANKAVIIVVDVSDGNYLLMSESGEVQQHNWFSTNIGVMIIFIGLLLFFLYHRNGHKDLQIHEESHQLKKLQSYLRESLVAGHKEKEITQALIRAGWDQQTISRGFRKVRYF